MISKDQIFKIYGTDYKEMTKELLQSIEASALIPDSHTLIGIKPNLVSPSAADQGGITHPEIVSGIIEYLKENGFDNIIMLEGSWVGDKTTESYTVSGFDKVSEQYGVL